MPADWKALVDALVEAADVVTRHYRAHVWLVGSALVDGNLHPRDWDIRVEISDHAFRKRYGDPATWADEGSTGAWTRLRHRWSEDCASMSRRLSKITGINIDFQVYPVSHASRRYAGLPRLRLDRPKGAELMMRRHSDFTISDGERASCCHITRNPVKWRANPTRSRGRNLA